MQCQLPSRTNYILRVHISFLNKSECQGRVGGEVLHGSDLIALELQLFSWRCAAVCLC